MTEEKAPEKLNQLDPSVRRFLDWLTPQRLAKYEWLAMRTDAELENLEEVCDWSEEKLARLSRFLSMPKEEFEAGFEVVQQYTRRRWLRQSGLRIVGVVTAIIVLYNLVWPYVDAFLKTYKR